jgi:hypothetical protein
MIDRRQWKHLTVNIWDRQIGSQLHTRPHKRAIFYCKPIPYESRKQSMTDTTQTTNQTYWFQTLLTFVMLPHQLNKLSSSWWLPNIKGYWPITTQYRWFHQNAYRLLAERLFQCDTYPHLKVKFKSIYIYLSNLHNDNTDFIIINHSCERCYRGVQTSTPVYTLNCKCPVVILTAALFSVFFLRSRSIWLTLDHLGGPWETAVAVD